MAARKARCWLVIRPSRACTWCSRSGFRTTTAARTFTPTIASSPSSPERGGSTPARNATRRRAKPVPAGSFVTHYGKQIHYDGAKDAECILQIVGIGPATSTSLQKKIERREHQAKAPGSSVGLCRVAEAHASCQPPAFSVPSHFFRRTVMSCPGSLEVGLFCKSGTVSGRSIILQSSTPSETTRRSVDARFVSARATKKDLVPLPFRLVVFCRHVISRNLGESRRCTFLRSRCESVASRRPSLTRAVRADARSAPRTHPRESPGRPERSRSRPAHDRKGPGAPGRIRTCGLRLRRPSLYPAELRARTGRISRILSDQSLRPLDG